MSGIASGIFISHIAEEAPVAYVLKRYLRLAFGDDLQVFVSTDKTSIPPGQQWYDFIIQSLKRHAVTLTLLSQESCRRGWITFEAGFGVGVDSLVIPLRLSRLPPSQVPYPMAGSQSRSIDDIGFVVDDIAKKLGRAPATFDVDAYLDEVAHAEAALNYRALKVEPVADGGFLTFDIANVGNTDLELLLLEVMIPGQVMPTTSYIGGPSDGIDRKHVLYDGLNYIWLACYSPRGTFGQIVPVLRPILTPSMGVVRPDFRVHVGPLSSEQQGLTFLFQIHAVGYNTEIEERKLGDLFH